MYEFDWIEIERCDLDLKTGSLSLKNAILIFKTWRQSYFEIDDGLDTIGESSFIGRNVQSLNNDSAGEFELSLFLMIAAPKAFWQ